MTRTMLEQWRQANDFQCPNCRSVPSCPIQCSKCKNGFRLNHNRATCGVCDATAHLECTAMGRKERERLKQGLRSLSCCILPATMTMPNSYILYPIHQSAMKSFVTPATFQSLLTFTCSECHRVNKKSSPRATCITSDQSRHLACTYLPRRGRERIRDGYQE